MSKKRHLESMGSLNYSKLPCLQADAGPHILRSSTLPNYSLDNHYGYRRYYLDYSLQCQERPKSHWAPSEAYAHGTRSPASQQLQAEKVFCQQYPRTQGQLIGKEKNGECVTQETLSAPERWASWIGYPEFSTQSWIHDHVAQQLPRATQHCPSLAVPKPIYQNHIYNAESAYVPKALRMEVESTSKLPLGTEWTTTRLGHSDCTENPSNSTGVLKKATVVANSNFAPGAKHTAMSPAGFLPYRKAYEKCQGNFLGGSFMEVSYPVVCSTQKNVPETHGGNPSKYMWSKQPPPVSPMAHPTSMMHQDGSSACYALPPYPLTTHEQMLLYHQSFTQAEKMNSLLPLPICKDFGSLGCEDPQLFPPRSYFPLMHENYYPNLLERYLDRTADPPVSSSGLLSSRQPEDHQNSKAKAGMEKSPNLTCITSEKAFYSTSLPRDRDVFEDSLEGSQAVDIMTKTSFPNQCPAPKPQISQPFHSLEQSPVFFSGSGQTSNMSGDAGFSHSEKTKVRGEKQTYPSKPLPLTSDTKKRPGDDHKTETGACLISDSLCTHLKSSSKGYQSTNVPEDSQEPRSPEERTQSVNKRPERLSPSPPMPIINNVFSLAPYRDYLEGTSNTVELALSNSYQPEDAFPNNLDQKAESRGFWQMDSARLSESSLVPSTDKGTSCSGMTEVSGNSLSIKMKGLPRASESVGIKYFPAAMSRGGISSKTGETEDEVPILELSCKMEDMLEMPLEKKAEENSQSKVEELKEGPSKQQDTLPETSCRTSELSMKSGPEGKSNFQSSAAFLFKKFKILKSHTASLGSTVLQNSSLQFQPISAKPPVLSRDFSPQQCSDQVVPQQGSPAFLEIPSQVAVQQNTLPVLKKTHHGATGKNSSSAQHSHHQGVTQLTGLLIQQRPQQEFTQRNRSPVQQSSCQAVTHQSSSPVSQSVHQQPTLRVSSPVQQSPHQAVTHQSNSPVQQSANQAVTHQSISPIQQSVHQQLTLPVSKPVQQSPYQVTTQQTSLSIQPGLPQTASQPEAQFLQLTFVTAKPSDTSKVLPPSTPASSPVLEEAKILVPSNSESHEQQDLTGQFFMTLHNSICSTISCSVTTSSLEQLQEWLKKAESPVEPKEKVVSLAKHKNGLKASSNLPKLSNGKQIWLAFKNMANLFRKFLSQLDTFLLTRKCPFPHVVRAGAIFIPIHVVKGKLFPNLSSASVDHVLQNHKVELRPTTLSEEKLLRDLKLKSCTSRMLKLLALKQLPDIYPDLLTLQWHECVKQQLGPSSQTDLHASK